MFYTNVRSLSSDWRCMILEQKSRGGIAITATS